MFEILVDAYIAHVISSMFVFLNEPDDETYVDERGRELKGNIALESCFAAKTW